MTVGHCSLKLLLVAMKSIFRSIASLGPWVRLLIKVGGCVSLAAFVLLWAPWRTEEPWIVPTGRPTTVAALKQEAADVAERMVREFPRDPDSHALKGNACLFSGNTAEAVKAWEKGLELDPARAGAYDGISLVAWEGGRFEEVVAACRQALKHDPNMPDVHVRLGRALMEMGRTEELIAAAQRAVGLWPRSSEAHLLLGQGHMQSKEYAKARKCFVRVIEIRPDHTKAYYGLATASAKLGQREKAKQHKKRFDELINAERDNLAAWTRDQSLSSEWSDQRARTAAIYVGAAGIYRKHGNEEQAKRLLQRAATIDPKPRERR